MASHSSHALLGSHLACMVSPIDYLKWKLRMSWTWEGERGYAETPRPRLRGSCALHVSGPPFRQISAGNTVAGSSA